MKTNKLVVAALVAGALGLIAFVAVNRNALPLTQLDAAASPVERHLASLGTADGWLNTPPVATDQLRGKVVVVQFWTYSCINWLRTLPYVRAWSDKYKDQGFVVVGVHTPEFEFEKNIANVSRAAKQMSIGYPIAIDTDYSIWRAFNNQYWPALYVMDAQGRIRHQKFGEGGFVESERMIQKLLAESGQRNVSSELVSVEGRGAEAAADWDNLKSGENYLGYRRTTNFSSPGGVRPGRDSVYSTPSRLALNQWALAGEWTMHKQFTVSNKSGSRISYRFHARDVHLVMGPDKPGTTVRFRVLVDGRPPGVAHGADVDEKGNGVMIEQRLYQLIRQPPPIIDRVFEIEFIDPGAEAFAFTFG